MVEPMRVAKAQHGSDHWTVGNAPPFFAVTRTEQAAREIALIPVMRAEIHRLVMLCQEAHDAILGAATDKELLDTLERAWTERKLQQAAQPEPGHG